MDSQAVAHSIEAKYKDLGIGLAGADGGELPLGRRFLEKIIQIPFVIPSANPDTFNSFARRTLGFEEEPEGPATNRHEVAEAEALIGEEQERGKSLDEAAKAVTARSDITAEAIAEAEADIRARSLEDLEEVRPAVADAVPYLGYNPRKIKRFINIFNLQALIANRRGLIDDGTIELDPLARWVIIPTRWPAVPEAIMSDSRFTGRLLEAHDAHNALHDIEAESEQAQTTRTQLELLLTDPSINEMHKVIDLVRLLEDLDVPEDGLLPYLYLTRLSS